MLIEYLYVFSFAAGFGGYFFAEMLKDLLTNKVNRIEAKIKMLEEKKLKIKSFGFWDEKVLLEKIDSEIKMLRKKLFNLFLK